MMDMLSLQNHAHNVTVKEMAAIVKKDEKGPLSIRQMLGRFSRETG